MGLAIKALFEKTFFLSCITFVLMGCSTPEPLILQADLERSSNYRIDAEIEADEDMGYFIQPYAAPIRRVMGRVLTVSEGPFIWSQPEGALGNFIADILRSRATYEMRARVDIAIMNHSGLNAMLPEGEITMGHVFELLPHEHHITVLEFTGEQILQIADEIAAMGGEPVSGLRMRIRDGKAADVLVGYRQVNPERHYLVAASSWLADGGGNIPSLGDPITRVDHELLIREAFIDHLRNTSAITPIRDHRLR